MGYQFAHVETYSLHGSTMKQKKGQARSTVGDVIGEAMRDDGHVSHLLKAGYTPAPPTFLHGDEAALRSIPDKIQQQLDAYNATSGKAKTRKDMHTLLAGVDSFPREVMEADPARYDRWKQVELERLKRLHGSQLVAVVEHLDEAQPHIHYYVLAPADEPDAKMMVAGHRACKDAGVRSSSKEGRSVYAAAMREWQDDYYREVGHPLGLERFGPQRLRLTRKEWATRKHDNTERVALDTATLSAQADILETASQTLKKAHKQRLDAQEMAAVMVRKGHERAAVVEAQAAQKKRDNDAHAETLKAKAKEQHEEGKRLRAVAQELDAYRVALEAKAQHLDAATAGIVVVKVPPAPKALASVSMEPGANAPGIPTPAPVPVWMPSAPPGLG